MVDAIVTGAGGFVGKHLVRRLKDQSADFLSIYHASCLATDSFSYSDMRIQSDLTDFNKCLEFISRYNPKIIFHLAAQPIVETATRHPFDTFEVNVRGAYNLLEAIRQAGKPSAIVWMSTDKVYGENEMAVEDDPLNGVEHPYNASKVCGDVLAQTYAKSFGIPIMIVRSGNIYGEADFHWERIVPGLIRNLFHGKALTLRSDGTLKRDYIYVEDVVDALMQAASETAKGNLGNGQAINLGSTKSYTVLEVVDELLGISGHTDLAPVIANRVHDELKSEHMNWEFAGKTLDWNPKMSLHDGLEKTWRWYKWWFHSQGFEEQ